MADRTWTRQHDAVLAERCEGRKVKLKVGVPVIPLYSTNLLDTIRAADALKEKKGLSIWGFISTQGGYFNGWAIASNGVIFDAFHRDPALALAWALYDAVGGV